MNRKQRNVIDPRIGEALLEAYVGLVPVRDGHSGEVTGYRVTELNEKAAQIFGLTRDLAIGKDICEILSLDPDCWCSLKSHAAERGGEGPFEYQFERSNRRFLLSHLELSPDQELLFFSEITYLRKAEEALRVHEVLFEGAHDIIFYTDMTGRIFDANQRALEAYGYSKEELLTLNTRDLCDPATLGDFAEQMERADAGGFVFESLHRRSDGSLFPVEVSAKSTDTTTGRLVIHIIRDITQRKVQEAEIARLATYDGLTGVLNRSTFIEELEAEIERAKQQKARFALLLFDIDNFKATNDCFGHAAGDFVLEQVAKKVQSLLRTDDKVGRLGGDEFVILQTQVEKSSDVLSLVDRITEAFSKPLVFQDQKLRVNLSIGASLFPDHATSAGDLVVFADKAMYVTKHGGGKGFSFYQPMTR